MNQYKELFKFLKLSGTILRKKVITLILIFRQVDKSTARFMKESGLKCERGCGRCCLNPYIEVTPLEMFPVALEMIRRKEINVWLKKLDDTNTLSNCVLYQPDSITPGRGRCSMYAFRPLICRLFGFSASTNKHGVDTLITCRTIKQNYPYEFEKTQKEIQNQTLKAPRMREYAMKVSSIDPVNTEQRLPINQALKIALQKMESFLNYSSQSHTSG